MIGNIEFSNKQELFSNVKYFCFCDKYMNSNKEPIELHAKVTIESNIPVYQSSMDIQYDAIQAKCPYCGNELTSIDDKIFDQIRKLNEKGYITRFSCEGHTDSTIWRIYGSRVLNLYTISK